MEGSINEFLSPALAVVPVEKICKLSRASMPFEVHEPELFEL